MNKKNFYFLLSTVLISPVFSSEGEQSSLIPELSESFGIALQGGDVLLASHSVGTIRDMSEQGDVEASAWLADHEEALRRLEEMIIDHLQSERPRHDGVDAITVEEQMLAAAIHASIQPPLAPEQQASARQVSEQAFVGAMSEEEKNHLLAEVQSLTAQIVQFDTVENLVNASQGESGIVRKLSIALERLYPGEVTGNLEWEDLNRDILQFINEHKSDLPRFMQTGTNPIQLSGMVERILNADRVQQKHHLARALYSIFWSLAYSKYQHNQNNQNPRGVGFVLNAFVSMARETNPDNRLSKILLEFSNYLMELQR